MGKACSRTCCSGLGRDGPKMARDDMAEEALRRRRAPQERSDVHDPATAAANARCVHDLLHVRAAVHHDCMPLHHRGHLLLAAPADRSPTVVNEASLRLEGGKEKVAGSSLRVSKM